MLNRYSGKSRGELYKITKDLKNKNQWNPIDAHEIDKAYQETEVGVAPGELASYTQAREQAFARETPEFQETINDLRFADLEQEEKSQRMAGEQLDNNLEALITRAKGSLQAEADGYIKLGDSGFDSYGEKEALAEQSMRIRIADEERYGGERPYLASKFNSAESESVTAEQKRNRMLIMEGKLPNLKSVPYDSFKGSEVKQKQGELGIDGNFKDDSEVRRHTVFGQSLDPLLGDEFKDELGARSIERMNVNTEILSNQGLENMYGDWKQVVEKENREGIRPFHQNTGIPDFNRFLAEYYGQQGLKLSGRQSVNDSNRSRQAKNADRFNEPTTVGTDRIIETSPGFLSGEYKGNPKDYRYLDLNGNVVVGDSQTLPNNDNSTDIALELINASNMSNTQAANLRKNLNKEAERLKNENNNAGISNIFKNLAQSGELPPMRSNVNAVQREGGMKVGKGLSASKALGKRTDDTNSMGHQYQAREVLYSTLPKDFKTELGVRPSNMLLVDLDKADNMLGDPRYLGNIQHFKANGRDQKGKIRAVVSEEQLIKEDAAQKLLSRALMNQLK